MSTLEVPDLTNLIKFLGFRAWVSAEATQVFVWRFGLAVLGASNNLGLKVTLSM